MRIVSALLLGLLAAPAPGPAAVQGARAVDAAAARDTLLHVNGTRLFVHREGSGPAAIVVHGGPLLDHGYMRPGLAPLGDRVELVFYDQRLSGRSEGSVDSASVRLDTLVADIEAIRTELGLGPVHLIAHSWGGLLAQAYAVRHPEHLRSLVLVSPMPPTTGLWQEEQRAQAASLEPADTAGLGDLRADPGFARREPAAVEAALRHSFRSQLHDPSRADGLDFYIAEDYGARSRQFGLLMPDLMSYDLTEALREVEVPTLVVYGAEEPGAGIGSEVFAEVLPDAEVHRLPQTGHFAFLERPEAFRELVRGFWDGR